MSTFSNISDVEQLLGYLNRDFVITNELYHKTMNKQEQALNSVRAGNFIVGSIDTAGMLSFNSSPATHNSATSARQECARLAKIYPGKAFVFVKLSGAELVPVAQTVSI